MFVPTPAYHRALAVLREHGFLVLTGPPEMGKTAIARMLGLALLSQGWEVHECTRPQQVYDRFDADRPQLFIADDAFGSTEYRPDAAERWAAELDAILRSTDETALARVDVAAGAAARRAAADPPRARGGAVPAAGRRAGRRVRARARRRRR